MNFWTAMRAAQEGGHQVRPTSWGGVGYVEWDYVNEKLIDDQGADAGDLSAEQTWETVETLVTAATAFQTVHDGGTAKRIGWEPSLTLTKETDPVSGDRVKTLGGGWWQVVPEDLIATDWVIVTPAP